MAGCPGSQAKVSASTPGHVPEEVLDSHHITALTYMWLPASFRFRSHGPASKALGHLAPLPWLTCVLLCFYHSSQAKAREPPRVYRARGVAQSPGLRGKRRRLQKRSPEDDGQDTES